MLGLVCAEETGRLDLGGRASGELLVEADDSLQPDGIGVHADGLGIIALHRQHILALLSLPIRPVRWPSMMPIFSPSHSLSRSHSISC